MQMKNDRYQRDSMQGRLTNKQIILGVTAGIAAYKSADLVRRLREAGADVRVVMTSKAKEFITPLTMQAVSGHPVHEALFDLQAEAAMSHIELARWADVIVVAPASADFIARLAQGTAEDLLATLSLASVAPVVLVPAMNQGMWKNPITQSNIEMLRSKSVIILGPAEGSQACGDTGPGRMLEPLEIVERLILHFQTGRFAGKTVLITAGPTREAIDPVRFITNASSGKMGYALAEAAVAAGAKVTLISGPVSLPRPERIKVIEVFSAEEMLAAVQSCVTDCDFFFAAAAVGDYRPVTVALQKIAKRSQHLTLNLTRTTDIIASVTALEKKPKVIGFAAETEHVLAHAKEKLLHKKMDMIIANQVGPGLGMGEDENAVTVLWGENQKAFEKTHKTKLARGLIELVADVFL